MIVFPKISFGCRVLIIYTDGFMTLWDIQESKAIFTAGGTTLQSVSHETKKVTAATWACPVGSKVVVGYSNGEILMWSVPAPLNSKFEQAKEKDPLGPVCKLNLGYKLDKIPIAKLKWAYADGKASRLYVIGSSDYPSANLLQVTFPSIAACFFFAYVPDVLAIENYECMGKLSMTVRVTLIVVYYLDLKQVRILVKCRRPPR